MEDASTDSSLLSEAAVFLKHFNDLPDRRQRGEVRYPLDEFILLTLLAVLAGADSVVETARFGCRNASFSAGFGRSLTALRRMIASATSSPPTTRRTTSAASSHGRPR